ncbi:MAG: hypothetical protein JWR67_3073 [Mucilaginibacter sp.]|nr:hypothetical protein [Mucilaginibacter sp.]
MKKNLLIIPLVVSAQTGLNLLGLFILILFFSCNKNDTTVSPPPTTTVEITVKDGNSWTPSNTTMNLVSGATIKLYDTQTDIINNNPPKYTATTDQSGKASIPVAYKNQYFFTAQKGKATNVVINGLLIVGIFQTQSEIQSSPSQTPAATIGSPKYLDTNGDGKITSPQDNVSVYGDSVDLIQNQTVSKISIIYQ